MQNLTTTSIRQGHLDLPCAPIGFSHDHLQPLLVLLDMFFQLVRYRLLQGIDPWTRSVQLNTSISNTY